MSNTENINIGMIDILGRKNCVPMLIGDAKDIEKLSGFKEEKNGLFIYFGDIKKRLSNEVAQFFRDEKAVALIFLGEGNNIQKAILAPIWDKTYKTSILSEDDVKKMAETLDTAESFTLEILSR